jgi:FAD/FMN-containing dehydrogenase
MLIHGWGRHLARMAEICHPFTRSQAAACVAGAGSGPLIARGGGRSYGDSALAERVMDTSCLNLLLDFDATGGVVRCSAGVTLAELLEVIVPKGWFLPVTPGTRFVSIGGAIASDVHGKNHHRDGCFSNFVEEIDLLLGDGDIVTCSVSRCAELVHASCGGMGLTGVILAATIRLKAIGTAFIEQTTIRTGNLRDTLALLAEHRSRTYSVAWIDCLATGAATGRSLLMLGEHAEGGGLGTRRTETLSVPLDMPDLLMNRYAGRTFNALYYHLARCPDESRRRHYEAFFYPLDNIRHWNRLYGERGFVQYHFVLPEMAGWEGIPLILNKISDSRYGVFLAVIKLLGEANKNYLSFPMKGYSLALDFKMAEGLLEFLQALDAIVLDYGGRLYLTKDSRMSAEMFKRTYPDWEAFQEVRERHGARGKFRSCQSVRLGLD